MKNKAICLMLLPLLASCGAGDGTCDTYEETYPTNINETGNFLLVKGYRKTCTCAEILNPEDFSTMLISVGEFEKTEDSVKIGFELTVAEGYDESDLDYLKRYALSISADSFAYRYSIYDDGESLVSPSFSLSGAGKEVVSIHLEAGLPSSNGESKSQYPRTSFIEFGFGAVDEDGDYEYPIRFGLFGNLREAFYFGDEVRTPAFPQ